MKVRVRWLDGSEADFEMETLRELDRFVGDHSHLGVVADLKPLGEGLRLVFSIAPQQT